MWTVVAALGYITVVCALAVYKKAYKDNMLQQWGLVCAFFGCIGLMFEVSSVQHISNSCAALLLGICFFATGTVAKVVHFNRKERMQNGCNSLHT